MLKNWFLKWLLAQLRAKAAANKQEMEVIFDTMKYVDDVAGVELIDVDHDKIVNLTDMFEEVL